MRGHLNVSMPGCKVTSALIAIVLLLPIASIFLSSKRDFSVKKHNVWNSRRNVSTKKIGLRRKFQTLATTSKHPRNTIGPAVRRHRVALGWSQTDFAARCQLAGWDISRGIVAAIEGRVRWVGDFEVALLARVLRTSIISLFPEQMKWAEFRDALRGGEE